MCQPNKTSIAACLLVFLCFCFACGSGRSVKRTAASVRAEREVSEVDTACSVQTVLVTTADTASETEAETTLEVEVIALTWDTIGARAVLTSAERRRMTTRLMERTALMKSIENMLSEHEDIRIATVVESDTLSAVQEEAKQPETKDVQAGTAGRVLTFFLFLMLFIAATAVVMIVLTLIYRMRCALHDGKLY